MTCAVFNEVVVFFAILMILNDIEMRTSNNVMFLPRFGCEKSIKDVDLAGEVFTIKKRNRLK